MSTIRQVDVAVACSSAGERQVRASAAVHAEARPAGEAAARMASPTFVCRFSDGVVTRMTTHCADGLDLRRGIALARIAYQSRTKGGEPPLIVEARFQEANSGVVLCEYDDKTIKQNEGA